MTKNPYLMLPLAALAVSMLSGCSNLGALMGANQPVLSPAAKAAAEMPMEKDPVVNTQDTYLALVRQMQSKSLWYASIAHLDALDKQWGVSSDSRLLRADALRQVGQLNAAIPLYQGLLGSAKDSDARYGLGRIAAETGEYSKAAQQMEQARMANPVDPRLLTDLGYAYLRARELNAARTPLMQAAQLNPEDAQANANLSLFMMVSGQSAQAEEFMRQRKLDAQTQQAVKEQAAQWLQGAQQAAAEPVQQATGKVVNLSRPDAVQAQATVTKTVAPAANPVQEAVQEVPAAKKSVPESEPAQAPVVAPAQSELAMTAPTPVASASLSLPLPMAQPASVQSVERMPSGGQWMVSGSSFDSARPRYPAQFAPRASQTYAYAVPAPVQGESSAPIAVAVVPEKKTLSQQNADEIKNQKPQDASKSVAKAAPAVAVPQAPVKLQESKPAAPSKAIAVMQDTPAKPVPHSEPVSQPVPPQVVPRQPTGPARSLQDGSVVMAVASPAAVRQVDGSASKQAVQAMLPRRASSGGLFFETPDEPTGSKPVAATQSSSQERVWP